MTYIHALTYHPVPRMRLVKTTSQFRLPSQTYFNNIRPNPLAAYRHTHTHIYIYIYTHTHIHTCLTAQLTSRRCILNIYSTNIFTEYFKHAALSLFFSLQDAVYFIMLYFLVPVIFTF